MAGTIPALTCARRGQDGNHSRAPCPAHANNGQSLPAARYLPADYALALQVLLDEYANFFTSDELEELRLLAAKPALPPLKRARLSVLASITVSREAEVRHGD
jgi:hypothetical protein